MKKCRFCGAELDNSVQFCSNCGARMTDEPTVETSSESGGAQTNSSGGNAYTYNAEVKRPRSLNTPMFVWAIINAGVSLLSCCSVIPLVSFVLGAVAIVFTVLAKDSDTDEMEKSRLKTTKILNITATCILAASLILTVIMCILAAIGFGGYASDPSLWQYYHYFD